MKSKVKKQRTRSKWEKFGVTKKYVSESLRYSNIITIIGLVIIALLGFGIGFKPLNISLLWLPFYVIISVPVQEFVFRGVIQTSLYRFGKNPAVITTSLVYAAVHFYDPLLVILTLAAGLAWGYAFYKKPNLLGPIISHAVLGVFLFAFVL
jgi:membrane protease YdiL (CAAX protease family)